MSKFKDFLKMNEAGAGPVAPTLTAGPDWQFPNSQSFAVPNSFTGMAHQNNYYDKPLFKALQSAQMYVQNIVAEPERYAIPGNARAIISGNPRTGGTISGLDYNKMITVGASRGLKFMPAEFDTLRKLGIFTTVPASGTTPQTTIIDLGKLYQTMKKEIGTDHGKDIIAAQADNAMNALTTGLTTPKSTQAPGRKQYGGV
jgi:hypothetical protein